MHELSILIATRRGRNAEAARAQVGYERETDANLQILRGFADDLGEAWRTCASAADGRYLHFTTDELEPHPGWFDAATAAIAAGVVAAPAIWRWDGSPPPFARDWAPALGSAYPTLSREQFDLYGGPPLGPSLVDFVERPAYAFTSWK